MGIKERGSGEPQEEALVNSTPNAEERLTPAVVEIGAEEVVAEAESVSSLTPAPVQELLPMPAFVPAAEVSTAVGAVPVAVELHVPPSVPDEPAPRPVQPEPSHAEAKLGLSALALVGFLSFYRQTHRPERDEESRDK